MLLTVPPLSPLFFFILIPPPPRSTLFPYTTLIRSSGRLRRGAVAPAPDRHRRRARAGVPGPAPRAPGLHLAGGAPRRDRKSTRLNSSHVSISYAVFCLKKKKNTEVGTDSLEYLYSI